MAEPPQKKKKQSRGYVQHHIRRFLMNYRNTPHPETGYPPAQLMFN